MKRIRLGVAVLVAFCCFSTDVLSKELVAEFKGTGNSTTAEFEVEAPWIVDWFVTGDYPGQMAVHANLVDATTGSFLGKLFATKYVTNGVKLLNQSGRFQIQVNSSLANWSLRVEKLSEQEAANYTPKNQ